MSNRSLLKTVGFPRSGNTYLNYALKHSYYPEERPNPFWHTVAKLDAYSTVLVPFRDPVDCIASWNLLNNTDHLIMDINHYIRFHTAVLSKDHVVLLDFDYFTKDFNYMYEVVEDGINIIPVKKPTDETVRQSMLRNNWEANLPRNNQEELEKIKVLLVEMPEFKACLDLYNQLKIRSLT